MSANATGTSTALGIPTFNVSQDPPNGLGVNEMMAAIDALIAQRLKVIGTPLNGQLVQWNSGASQWQPATLVTGPGAPVTALPGSPSDTQQAILVDSTSAPTYAWLLQYNTAAAKWSFIGGSAIEGTTSLIIPRAGDYYVEIGGQGSVFSAGVNTGLTIAAGGITLNATQGAGSGGTEQVMGSLFDKGRMVGLTASQVLTPTVTGSPTRAYIRALPVSVT